jgi:hypothetical protein
VKTLTLFNAYVKARDKEDALRAWISFSPRVSDQRRHRRAIERRERQRSLFAAAIRERLTPPAPVRRRITRVSIGNVYAFIDRNDEGNGGGYQITPSSRRRLIQVCNDHMQGDSLNESNGGNAWWDILVYMRKEAQP